MPVMTTVSCVCDSPGCTTSVPREISNVNFGWEMAVDTLKSTLPEDWTVVLDENTGWSTWFCPVHSTP